MDTLTPGGPFRDRIRGPEYALIAAILAASMALRLWRLSWGLPDVFEEAIPFTVARSFWGNPGGNVSFHPDFFHYPALSFYLQFIVQALQYAAGALTGQFDSLDAFRRALATDPGSFMIPARLVSVLFDVATVGLAWITAREMFGRGTAAGAALFVAFNPLLLAGAQGVNVDVILTFFLMLTLRRTLRLTGAAGVRDFVLTGVTIGLAASAKYTGALFLALPVFIIAAGFAASPARPPWFTRRETGLALLIPVCAGSVFALLNPYILLDHAGFLRDFTYEAHHMSYGHLGIDTSQSSAAFYLLGTIAPKLGLLFAAGALAGVFIVFAGKNPGGIGVAAMAAIYVAVISTWEMRAERYLLPAIPLLSILSAAGWVHVTRWAVLHSTEPPGLRALRPVLAWFLPAAALCAALAVPALESRLYLEDLGKTDTRTLAKEWIDANVAPGSVIVSGPFGIAFPPGRQVLYIPFVATGAEATAPFYDVRWYSDFELLVASDYDYARYSAEPERFSAMMKFYADLRSGWKLLTEIAPGQSRRGPAIWFYSPEGTPQTDAFDPDLLSGLATIDNVDVVVRFVQNLSGALFARGKLTKCSQLLRLGLRLSPDDPALGRRMAFLLFKEGRTAEALEYIARAERSGGESFDLLSLHANILIRSGDDAGAEGLLLKARRLRPDASLPYTLLAGIYSGRRDTARLVETLEGYRTVVPAGSDEAVRIGAWLDSLKGAR
jgi:4-amino-4-deoxy-L-arabinose transferase-like glycosyltransferase